MAQTIVDFDDEEEKIITQLKKNWELSKTRTIKKVIAEYKRSS